MTRILVINGPNLNNLGRRDVSQYGTITLADIEERVKNRADELNADVAFFQSNHEGFIIDFIQSETENSHGIIINAGALTQIGYPLLDAILDSKLPTVEVHLSNIHGREEFRRHSVIAPFALGQIAGLGWRGYTYALESLVANQKETPE